MSPDDARLVAALTMLGDQLPLIVDEVLAGEFDQDERREFARVLATIAGELDSGLVLPADAPALATPPLPNRRRTRLDVRTVSRPNVAR